MCDCQGQFTGQLPPVAFIDDKLSTHCGVTHSRPTELWCAVHFCLSFSGAIHPFTAFCHKYLFLAKLSAQALTAHGQRLSGIHNLPFVGLLKASDLHPLELNNKLLLIDKPSWLRPASEKNVVAESEYWRKNGELGSPFSDLRGSLPAF